MIHKWKGLQGYTSTGRAENALSEQKTITAGTLNTTADIATDLFFVFSAEQGSDYGDYEANITFTQYEYDPNCDINKLWNGTDCAVDYISYCKSLTANYQKAYKNPNITVSYNGSACVIINPIEVKVTN